MEPYRERIEDFMRRYGYEGNRVLWVLALPALVRAILVVMVWLSLGPAGTQTSVDRNGFLWACGRKVLTEDRDFARECGKIAVSTGRPPQATPRAAPQAAGTSGD